MIEVGIYSTEVTTGRAKDIAVANRTGSADGAASDVNRRRATRVSVSRRWRFTLCSSRDSSANRTHGTGAIDVAHHCAVIDVDRGRSIHDTSQRIEELTVTIVVFLGMVRIILVRTAAATIDIAT